MNKQKLIDEIANKIYDCKKCPLYKTANKGVPGEGDSKAKIMFVGEAPGRVEDETGRPFVGRSGQLLNKLLLSIGLSRESVFITSVVKHRPPQNRQPKPSEVIACTYWLDQQLTIIQPRLICTLGRFGMEYFMPKAKISLIHGTIQETTIRKIKYMLFPLYHPSAALRSTRNKLKLEEDFKTLQKVIHDVI